MPGLADELPEPSPIPWEESRTEGRPIPSAELSEEVRVIRHNMRSMRTAVETHGQLLGWTTRKSAEAHEISARALQETLGLKHDVFGDPERRNDGGVLGDLRASVLTIQKQQWAILMLLLAALAAGFFAAVQVIHR